MTKEKYRKEKDLLGELEIPSDVYWGINTQRALTHFQISGKQFPPSFLLALGKVKKACLEANFKFKLLEEEKVFALRKTINELLFDHKFLDQFPVDIFQSGSGTQINMNMNEVLANRANEILGTPLGSKSPIHPNDHVNKSQSSNDVIPTAMHLSTIEFLQIELFPAIDSILKTLQGKISHFKGIIKPGRTHLQDAVPIPLEMEFEVYKKQIETSKKRLIATCNELLYIPLGGTALGTCLNAPKNFDKVSIKELSKITSIPFQINPIKAEGIASHNVLVKVSSELKLLALALLKMANDIRWMGSGPRAGLGELLLPQNEPGSSIMPGKINPSQSEALIQACSQIIGNDVAITFSEGFNSLLDLNVAKPIIIINVLESITLLKNGIETFEKHCLKGLEANIKHIEETLNRTLMLVTKLTPIIGYEKAGEITQIAYRRGKSIKEIIQEMNLDIPNLDELLDPKKMV